MKKRISVLISALMILSILVSGCSNSSNKQNSSSNASKSTNNKVTIKLSTWAGADEAKQLQSIIDKLNANSKDYVIEQNSNPADYDTRITTQLSAGSGPDLFWVSAQRATQLAAQGALLDITNYLSKSDNKAANVSDYYENALAPFKYQNKIYGLPWAENPVVLYINKDMFDKAKIPYPDGTWNWDKFLSVAQQLTVDANGKHPGESGFDKNNIKQWGFTLNGWPPVQMFVWQNNGEVITPDFKSSPIDTPEDKKAFEFYSELINSPAVPSQQTIKDQGFDTMFKNQEVAMFMGGAADSLETQVKFNCGVYEVPSGPTGKKVTFGDLYGMAINAKTKNPDVAFKAFIDLTNAIQEWKVVPPLKSEVNVDALKKLHPDRSTDTLGTIVKSMSYAEGFRYFVNYPDWDNIFWNQLMDPIINNKANPDDLIPKVKPQLDNVLKQYISSK
jgi:multiple sugar transport system substrate-binding protein